VRDAGFATPPQFTGAVRVREDLLKLPATVKRPTVWAVWTDLFHEAVPEIFIKKVFSVMTDSPQHTFLILTKRAERMCRFINAFKQEWEEMQRLYAGRRHPWPLRNVWLGVTVESQEYADRLNWLLQTPAAHRFVSVEPMLGPVDLSLYLSDPPFQCTDCGHREWDCACMCPSCGFVDKSGDGYCPACKTHFLNNENCVCTKCEEKTASPSPALDWVVCGPENGSFRRPFDPRWAEPLLDDCSFYADIPFFDKSPAPLRRELPWAVRP
jgi:protein gp37